MAPTSRTRRQVSGGACALAREAGRELRPMNERAILSALTDLQREAIQETLARAQLPLDAWVRIPSIRRVVATMAALNRLRHYEKGGMTRELAIDITAAELGLNPSTIASTLRRWTLDAFSRST